MLTLPNDILSLICEELGNQQDFGTLYSCALTGKFLLSPAIQCLYRIYNQSAVLSMEGNDAELTTTMDTLRDRVSKWALLWKSIIRSSQGKTILPYCLYIRVLELSNLAELFYDELFEKYALEAFFADDMAQFLPSQQTPMKKKTRSGKKYTHVEMDVSVILNAVGESITSFVGETANRNKSAAALEDISGGSNCNITADTLCLWTGRLSKLKSITLWDGSALDENVATSIANGCFKFDDLTFYDCLTRDSDADHRLASFFSGLRSNTLRSFSVLRANHIGPETLLTLNNHSRSLKILKLDGLGQDAVRRLSNLQGCVALEFLELRASNPRINLEATEVIEWLGRCESMRELIFGLIANAPSILTHLCLRNNINLQSLVVEGSFVLGNMDFHRAISHQTSLVSLELKADPEGSSRDDIKVLVDSICSLPKLKELKLLSTSEDFQTPHIIQIASEVKTLEEFWFSGYDITDDIWVPMAGLENLRVLQILAITSFTKEGISTFISGLQETNQGFHLAIMAQNPADDIPAEDFKDLSKQLATEVEGKFEFVLYRDVDADSDSLSD